MYRDPGRIALLAEILDLRHEATSRLAPLYQLHELAAITGHRSYQTLRRYYHPKAEELALKMRKAEP